MTRYGLDTLGSLEITHHDGAGWVMQAHSAPGRRGGRSQGQALAADPQLAVAVLLTAPTALSDEGYQVLGSWHIDEEARSVWVNVTPLEAGGAAPMSVDEVDELLVAEARWAQDGHGRVSG